MTNRRDTSIFNIIGPIMVGPSSSHTAGAVRLGLMGRGLLGAQPQQARIGLHGSFAETGAGHGTDKAVIAGLLGLATDDPRLPHSHQLAGEAGLHFTFTAVDLGEQAHPNSIHLHLRAGQDEVSCAGASVGGGQIEMTRVQGYEVSFNGELETLLIEAADQPGTINHVTGLLSRYEVNVAFLHVERDRRGGRAMMVVELDEPVEGSALAEIAALSWVSWLRKLPRLKE